MAYRVARFGLLHAAREAGAAAISSTTEDASFPHENLIDDRIGTLFKFTASAADLQIDIDRGASFAALDAIDRLYIPVGHNLSGTITVYEDDNSGFSSATTLLSAGAVPASGAVDLDMTASSERYIRVEFDGTGQWEIPQLVLTKTLTPSVGPAPGWDESPLENVSHFRKASGAVAHHQHGPDVQPYRLEYPGVDATADQAIFDALYGNGTHLVILFDPPYDDSTTILAWISERRRRNEEAIPAGGAKTFEYQFTVEESLA